MLLKRDLSSSFSAQFQLNMAELCSLFAPAVIWLADVHPQSIDFFSFLSLVLWINYLRVLYRIFFKSKKRFRKGF